MEQSLTHFKGKHLIRLVHDFCDLRKRYATKMEGLSRVRSLEGDMVNGFQTFNTVALSERGISFLGCTPIDTREPAALEDGQTFHKKAAFEQIRSISAFFKERCPDHVRLHLMDREIDDVAYFDFFEEELADKFVGRLKLNRSSVYKGWDPIQNKEVSVKLKDQTFAHRFEYRYEKLNLID